MPPIHLPKYVQRIKTRHGKYIYYWQAGRGTAYASKRHRLPDDPQSPEFWQVINQLQDTPDEAPGTFAALFKGYQESPEFAGLSEATKRDYRRYMDKIGPIIGDVLVREFRAKHGHELRDLYADRPTTANHLISVMQSAVAWGLGRDYADVNIFRDVKRLKRGGDGYDPWPQWALDLVWEHGPPDMIMAVALGLYTGQRRADVIRMGREAMECREGRWWLPVRQQKTGILLDIPIHSQLEPLLLKVEAGPFIKAGGNGYKNGGSFTAAWGRWLAGVPALGRIREAGLVFHGLRKNAVNALSEEGCTDREVSAITGHSLAMVQHYSRKANQRRMAVKAIARWEEGL